MTGPHIRTMYPRHAAPGAVVEILVTYQDGTHSIFAPGDKWLAQFVAEASQCLARNMREPRRPDAGETKEN